MSVLVKGRKARESTLSRGKHSEKNIKIKENITRKHLKTAKFISETHIWTLNNRGVWFDLAKVDTWQIKKTQTLLEK